MSTSEERYLVLGGSGFLGSYIVDALVARGEAHVFVYDLKGPAHHHQNSVAQYKVGDLVDYGRLLAVLQETQPTVIFHTIAPVHGVPDAVQYKVNVDGTKTLLEACKHPSVATTLAKLVYTSSTGVVWKVHDLHGVSEDDVRPPAQGYDSYHHTKAIAERMVLEADGSGLRTVVIRPCGMTGPRDQQLMHRLDTILKQGQHKVQIGNNKNLVDWAYAGNVADAHLLAADRLPAPDAADASMPHAVAGHAFFVTNGSPLPNWDFTRMVWRALGAPPRDLDPRNVTVLPRWLALSIARVAQAVCRLLGTSTELTVFAVQYSTATQWYNIDKARHVLGYEPKVTLQDAVTRTVQWWKDQGAAEWTETVKSSRSKKRD
ncbi:C-3 sterol dehydrogenase [Phanerochaete sordida]|uniref:C-3 sterol dehydrogenase n=1 Tax=Phanerochaete sordida TaxID=48140 RepID=A0A9P3G316_9APHY|nr:C-3 sterol dehydrogenase [Phanerochaete sordida]